MNPWRAQSLLFLGALAVAAFARTSGVVRADTPPPLVDVWSWGRNSAGQLGGVPPSHAIPWPTHEAGNWIAVAAGFDHVLALTATGEVWAWGDDSNGQLGNGTTQNSILPVRVAGLIGVTLIAAGGGQSYAYRASDATLWAWGSNSNGQLGEPPATPQETSPVLVSGLPALTAIATKGQHTLALGADGTVYAWGANDAGQLGLGDFVDRSTPTAVPLFAPAIAIGTGGSHSLAVVGTDAEVWAWGSNAFGQLGSGRQGAPGQGFSDPEPVLGVSGVDQVVGGDLHSLARGTDGSVWAWGYNTEGQTGSGDTTPADTGLLTAEKISGISGVASLAAGGLDSIALKSNGEVWTWGSNVFGTCGANGRADHLLPTKVVGATGATAVTMGSSFAVALASPRPSSGVVVMGDMTATGTAPVERPAVATVPGLTDVGMLAAGFHHALALDADHAVWAWGDNSSGQLGIPGASGLAPAPVDIPLDGAQGFVEVVARANFSLALRSDGAVFAWGDNTYGQLGTGSTTSTSSPVRVASLSNIVSLAAGERHGLALDATGTAWAWGQNLHGELGTPPSATLVTTPQQVPSLYALSEIAAGGFHNLFIDVTGLLHAWGFGQDAQLGDGGRSDATVPLAVALGRVASVSAGALHTLAILDGGQVWAFGGSGSDQLGDGSPRGLMWTPVHSNVTTPALLAIAGDYHSLALGYDGTVTAWGDDSRGQLGLAGTSEPHSEPVPGVAAPTALLAAGGETFTVLAVK